MRKRIFLSIFFASLGLSLIALGLVLGGLHFSGRLHFESTKSTSPLFSSVGLLILALVVFLTAVFCLSLLLSRILVRPIQKIDLNHPDSSAVYPELTPLVNRLSEQKEQIAEQLARLRSEHDKQDAMRRDFTANVSHELKTPLTSISGYAEIIQNGLAKHEDIQRFSGRIYEESQRLITLVGDIIRVSQLEGKDFYVKNETIDLYESCREILGQFEMAAKEKNVTLHFSGEHLYLQGARPIVEEIFFNIIDNAIKYNRQNGTVQVVLRRSSQRIEFSVQDTGIGIPQEDLEHVFERFYRVDKSHSKAIGGTGLGLSIVKHGAQFMNASISLTSEIGKGTTIKILF